MNLVKELTKSKLRLLEDAGVNKEFIHIMLCFKQRMKLEKMQKNNMIN